MHSNGERIKKLWNSSAVCHNKLSFYDFSTTEKQQENSFSELKWISNFSLSLLCCVCLLSLASHPNCTPAENPTLALYPSWISMHTAQQQVLYWFSLNFLLSQFASATTRCFGCWARLTTAIANAQSLSSSVVDVPTNTKQERRGERKNYEGKKHNQKQAEHNRATAKAKSAVIVFFSLRMDFYDFLFH